MGKAVDIATLRLNVIKPHFILPISLRRGDDDGRQVDGLRRQECYH